jgi:hypothetical protein
MEPAGERPSAQKPALNGLAFGRRDTFREGWGQLSKYLSP